MSGSLIGRMLGKYKIIENLGQGGMASVYLGYQELIDRQVAVKVLPPHPGLDEGFVERFELEARTIAKLQHPHIVPVFDYGREDDILYLVMAYVDGGTLADRLDEGPLSIRETEKILRELAGALDYAHRQGVIHRDIKPANILLSGEGFALLADFGIVKLVEDSPDLTGTGVVGTPAYMAPEAAQGNPIDSRIDVYSLGVLVYQMLTGEQPITAPSMMQLMLKVIQEPYRPIREVIPSLPPEIEVVFNRVLAKDPEDRYQTASEFAEDFSMAIHDTSEIEAIRTQMPLKPGKPVAPTEAQRTAPMKDRGTRQQSPPGMAETNPTVVVQQGISPMILLVVVGMMIGGAVLALLVVLSNEDGTTSPPTEIDDIPVIADPDEEAEPTAREIPTAPQIETFGSVTYSTTDVLGDTIALRVDDLAPPGDGVYIGWLVNTQTDDTLRLGEILIDGFGSGALTYQDPDERMLPTMFNAVLITEETNEDAETPGDTIAYNGQAPAALANALGEIFIASEDGLNGGSLLDGITIEARIGAQHAGLASRSSTIVSMRTHAEHTINALRGEEVDYDGDGDGGDNPGRGVGVYIFADRIETILNEAVADAPLRVASDAEFIRVCLVNTRQRADRVIELEEILLEEPLEADGGSVDNVRSDAEESTEIADRLLEGFDLNGDGNIDPFEGECGLNQIERYGLQIATLNIIEGGLSE